MYEMFLGPIEQDKPWDTKGIEGVHRFIRKFWRLFFDAEKGPLFQDVPANDAAWKAFYRMTKKIEEDTEKFSFNTAVSSFMIGINELTDLKCHSKDLLSKLLIVIAPYAPHLAEELWTAIGEEGSVLDAAYPAIEEKYLVETTKEYPAAVNGKTRTTLNIDLNATQADVEAIVW
jgi:leucyl-tRNA synthetase